MTNDRMGAGAPPVAVKLTVPEIEALKASPTLDAVARLADAALAWIRDRDELASELADVQLALDDVEDELQADDLTGMVQELVAKYRALRGGA